MRVVFLLATQSQKRGLLAKQKIHILISLDRKFCQQNVDVNLQDIKGSYVTVKEETRGD